MTGERSRRPHPWEASMSRSASVGIARTGLFDVDADRRKGIDQYIDYFGTDSTRRGVSPSDACDESSLDADGAR